MDLRWSIEAYTNADFVSPQEPQPRFRESCAVGLHRVGDDLTRFAELFLEPQNLAIKRNWQQRGLTTVPHELYSPDTGLGERRANSARQDREVHHLVRSGLPAVAVGAAQVAQPRRLEDHRQNRARRQCRAWRRLGF